MRIFASLALALLFITCAISAATAEHLVPRKTFDAIATEYSGEGAQEYDRHIIQYHRIQGSPMMAEVAEKVVLAKLKGWGIESKLEQFPSDGRTRYETNISPMGWDMRGGELWVESVAGDPKFAPFRLCRYSDVPMCVSTYSKGGDWTGELVDVGAGTKDKDYDGKDVRGKVALAYGYAGNVVREAAVKRGAIGVVIYPAADDRTDHPDMVRYNGIWPRAEELDKTAGGFQISANQYATVRDLMRKGPVRVHGKIDATLGPGQLTLVHAWIRGTQSPQQEVLITGHLDHPKWSANDNASGSAAMLEMARTLNALIASGKLPPPLMTIHFMWVPEYFGSEAYVAKHLEARTCNAVWNAPRTSSSANQPGACITVNLNLDMVGEDTVKTNSRFYITRTPDSVPGSLNGVMADLLQQTRDANLYAPTGTHNYWPAEMNKYVQGSDHDVFIALGIPSTMLGHDPDWTHHTSEDTIDKTDASEFRRVGVLATAGAYWLASQTDEEKKRAEYVATSDMISDRGHRVAEVLSSANSPAAQRRLETNRQELSRLVVLQDNNVKQFMAGNKTQKAASLLQAKQSYTGAVPHRLTVLPIAGSEFENLTGNDRKWWDEQAQRFASEAPGGGLPTQPPLEQIVFETVNFMDGKRTTAEIADLLSAEFNHDFDQPWVDRLLGILSGLKLVETK
jgi:aminopeptidase YwaD